MNRNINKNNKRYELLIETIERLEQGKYTGLDVHWCCDSISWLWKWRKITEEQKDSLCDRMIAIMESER